MKIKIISGLSLICLALVIGGYLGIQKSNTDVKAKPQLSSSTVPVANPDFAKCSGPYAKPPEVSYSVQRGNIRYWLTFSTKTGLFVSRAYIIKDLTEECEPIRGALFTSIKLSDFMPEEVAIELKIEYFKRLFDELTSNEVKKLLNEPIKFYGPETEGFAFFPEDIAALTALGYKLGPNTTRVNTTQDYRELDPKFKLRSPLPHNSPK